MKTFTLCLTWPALLVVGALVGCANCNGPQKLDKKKAFS
jgi:hypothetical protein